MYGENFEICNGLSGILREITLSVSWEDKTYIFNEGTRI